MDFVFLVRKTNREESEDFCCLFCRSNLDLMLRLEQVSIQVQKRTLMLRKVLEQYPTERFFGLKQSKNKIINFCFIFVIVLPDLIDVQADRND